MKEKFNPNRELLKHILWNGKEPVILKIPSCYDDTKEGFELYAKQIELFRGFCIEEWGEINEEDSQIILGNIFNEMLKNSMEHGNGKDPKKFVTVGLWFGIKGILFAFRDEGSFYGLESTKEKLESKISISSTRNPDPSGYGTQDLCEYATDIFVATEEKTLYLTYLLKNPISQKAP